MNSKLFACGCLLYTMFSEKEKEYIKNQRLARIATVSPESLQPDVVPVGFDFDGQNFYVGGKNLLKSTKYKNVIKNNKIGMAIDDTKPGESWEPRGVKIYGVAEMTGDRDGYLGHTSYLKITPQKKWSWGIEAPVFVDGKFVVNRKSTT
jgi:pyridoxamine 5'-phosphate oxidase family protein